jgi:hypothetical protein
VCWGRVYLFFDLVEGALERGFEFVGINDYILSRATNANPHRVD